MIAALLSDAPAVLYVYERRERQPADLEPMGKIMALQASRESNPEIRCLACLLMSLSHSRLTTDDDYVHHRPEVGQPEAVVKKTGEGPRNSI
jgi:hypothetical protein